MKNKSHFARATMSLGIRVGRLRQFLVGSTAVM